MNERDGGGWASSPHVASPEDRLERLRRLQALERIQRPGATWASPLSEVSNEPSDSGAVAILIPTSTPRRRDRRTAVVALLLGAAVLATAIPALSRVGPDRPTQVVELGGARSAPEGGEQPAGEDGDGAPADDGGGLVSRSAPGAAHPDAVAPRTDAVRPPARWGALGITAPPTEAPDSSRASARDDVTSLPATAGTATTTRPPSGGRVAATTVPVTSRPATPTTSRPSTGPTTTRPPTSTTRPIVTAPPPPPTTTRPPPTTTTRPPPTTTTTWVRSCGAVLPRGRIVVDQAYFVFDGQSNTLYPFYAEAYPTKLMNRRFAGQPYRVVAQGGTDFPERSATAAERTDSWVGTRPQTVLFNEGGPSDLLRGASGAQVFDRARRYVQDRRAAGFAIVIGVTVPPSTAYTPAMEQARLDYNARLRSDCYGAGLDVLVDVAAIRELQDPSDLRYYSDGAHFTSAATDLVAARYLAALP